jgi:hypothetical protein
MLYITVWRSSKSMHIKRKICKKKCVNFSKQSNSQIGTNVRIRAFNAGLLARRNFPPGSSCDRPTRSRFPVIFLGPGAYAQPVSKFHVSLHASHVALLLVKQKFRPNVALVILDKISLYVALQTPYTNINFVHMH